MQFKKRKKEYKKNNTGFTLLFSVLTASLLLSIGVAIFNITIKELTLSSAGRDSQTAFYAANSGIECALYHDLIADTFTGGGDPASCFGALLVIETPPVAEGVERSFSVSDPLCVDVTITKIDEATTIQSRGYSTCNEIPSRVERAIEVTY